MTDFTLTTYQSLLQVLKEAGYSFITFEEWCDGKTTGNCVIMRHDVDLRPGHSLAFAKIENKVGIRASYYFRELPRSNQPDIISEIVSLGHEIGYHYNEFSTFHGDYEKSMLNFEKQLAQLRQFYPVRTICMHGSPTSKYDNRDLWKKYNYNDFGIIGEPYFNFLGIGGDVKYFTDTARMWDGEKFNIRDKIGDNLLNIKSEKIHSTFDLINWLKSLDGNNCSLMITTHPQRWTNNKIEWLLELLLQNVKNRMKQLLMFFR